MERRDHEMKYAGTKTECNLREAFAGESQARNQYTFFAGVAREQGYEQIAALFLKTAENEREHAELWLKALEGISDTKGNLKAAQVSLLRVKINSSHLYCFITSRVLYFQKMFIVKNPVLRKVVPEQIL